MAFGVLCDERFMVGYYPIAICRYYVSTEHQRTTVLSRDDHRP